MVLDQLLARRLVFLTGKGGVGKSTLGMAMALAARDRGRRALLVEIAAPLEAARVLGRPSAGSRVTEALPGLFTVNLDPVQVMEEYVRQVVKVDLLVRKIVESPIYARFFSAAPGLKELMVLGKIMTLEEARERFSRKPLYDLIVVDAPATGHGLSFLKVPLAASEAVPVGPVGHNARRILSLLRDPDRTALAVLAIPEEMAVVEAIEFHRLATYELGMRPAALILNACHERRFPAGEEALVLRLAAEGAAGRLAPGVPLAAGLAAARGQIRRRKLSHFYETRLRRDLPLPLVTLPYLFREELSLDDLRLLASRLEAA